MVRITCNSVSVGLFIAELLSNYGNGRLRQLLGLLFTVSSKFLLGGWGVFTCLF
jgi:hypothetical protein